MTKHWKGAIDLKKKYKLEKGTAPIMPTTALEKFLDIFLLLIFLICFIFKIFITPLIFIYITYYYLAKKTLFLKQIPYII